MFQLGEILISSESLRTNNCVAITWFDCVTVVHALSLYLSFNRRMRNFMKVLKFPFSSLVINSLEEPEREVLLANGSSNKNSRDYKFRQSFDNSQSSTDDKQLTRKTRLLVDWYANIMREEFLIYTKRVQWVIVELIDRLLNYFASELFPSIARLFFFVISFPFIHTLYRNKFQFTGCFPFQGFYLSRTICLCLARARTVENSRPSVSFLNTLMSPQSYSIRVLLDRNIVYDWKFESALSLSGVVKRKNV